MTQSDADQRNPEPDPFKIEEHDNPNILTIHVRERLTDSHMLEFGSKDWRKTELADSGGLLRFFRILFLGRAAQSAFEHELNERRKNADFVDAIFRVEGVVSVIVLPYGFRLTKGQAFTWDEIRWNMHNAWMSRFFIPKLYGRSQ